MGPLGLGAAVLGAGGAGVATAEGPDALGWNAAALASDGWAVAYSSGSGGVANALDNALAVTGELDQVGHVGLLVQDQRFGGNFRESSVAGGLAVSAGPWLSIGTLQHLHQAEPGGLRGWSMDLGAGAKIPLGGRWALRLGVAGTDLASSLAWANGLEEAQPSVLRIGAAVEMAPGAWLALQSDRLDREGGSGSSQWRLGAQSAWFEQRLFVRAGLTQADASTMYSTVGLGGRLNLLRQAVEADYALLVPSTDAAGASLRHLVSLRWRFDLPAPAPEAGFSRVLKDKSGRVHRARIVLAQSAPVDTEDWQLSLKDSQGKVIKTFKGHGAMPPSVNWDGKADDGSLASVEGVSYDLRATDTHGKVLERHALLGPAPAALGGLDSDMAGVDGAAYGLRSSANAAERPRVRPSLKGKQDLVVAGADFDLSAVQDDNAHSWELRIVDAQGKTVKRYSGTGRPPKSLRWAGTDDLGQPVEASLGSGYELRVTGADGSVKKVSDDLVAPETFSALAEKARSAPREAPCVRDAARGELVCTLRFEHGSVELDQEGEATLRQVLTVLREVKFREVSIEGHADSVGEKDMNYQLSQGRADMAMKSLLEQGGARLTSLVAVGMADTEPLADNDSEEGRARNRRVEIRFKEEQ